MESKKSLAAIWGNPLEEWQVSFPIIKPTPTVVSNRQTNAAAARTRAQAAKSQSTETPSNSKKGKVSFLLPPGFTAPTLPSTSTPSAQSTLVPITYGCDAKDLPPPIIQYYGQALRFIFNAFIHAMDSIAGEKGKLDVLTNGEERAFQVRDNHKRYPYLVTIESEKAAFRAVFGDWAVRESFGKLLWAERPPTATSPVDGYAEALSMVNTAFRSSF
jgi:hypothetical protein